MVFKTIANQHHLIVSVLGFYVLSHLQLGNWVENQQSSQSWCTCCADSGNWTISSKGHVQAKWSGWWEKEHVLKSLPEPNNTLTGQKRNVKHVWSNESTIALCMSWGHIQFVKRPTDIKFITQYNSENNERGPSPRWKQELNWTQRTRETGKNTDTQNLRHSVEVAIIVLMTFVLIHSFWWKSLSSTPI